MRVIERDMLLRKIEEWQEKAQHETDPFNRYVSAFTAYNIFYNLYEKTRNPSANLDRGDKFRAIKIIALLNENELFQSLRDDLSEYVAFIPIYRDEYWHKGDAIPINRALEEGVEKEDKRRTMEMLLKWLYKVRCNLVHGEKNYNDENQKGLLKMSSSLLEKVLQNAVETYRQFYVLGEGRVLFDS